MVKFNYLFIKKLSSGMKGVCIFLVIYIYYLVGALLSEHGNSEYVLAVFTFPMSWLFLSVPILDWLSTFGMFVSTTIEWFLLFLSGVIEYWVIGTVVALLVSGTVQK